MSELKFVPLPDPRFPETLTPENIATLQAWGVIPREFAVYASREDWGTQAGPSRTFPEEGMRPKYWWPREPVEGEQRYLFLDDEVSVYRSNTDPAGFSHPVFEIYGAPTANFYRDYAPLFDGRIPEIIALTVPAYEANRKNVKQDTPVEYPIGAPRPGTSTGWSFPTDCALRFRPGTDIVEAFRKEDFIRHYGDPAKYDKPTGVMAAPKPPAPPVQQQPAVQQPPAPATLTPAPPAPVGGTTTYEGMEQDNSTGEAIVNGIQTGWYFERPTQIVPLPENPETGRQNITVKPWGFATASTAQRVLELLQVHTQLNLEIFKGEQDSAFPTSVTQRYIGVAGQPRRVAVNAGLIASQIARTTCEVSDGKGGQYITQNSNQAIAEAIAALQLAME